MLRDLIPARARKVIYTVFGFIITAESSLDVLGAGVMSTKVQGAIIAVAAAAGFTLARANVSED